MAKVKLTETVLNSAQHALMSTIMPLEDILPGLDLLDKSGYHSCEVWGRSSYIASMQRLSEDPWDRLRAIKKHMPNTRLQITFGGQYLFGIRPFSDDVVVYFIQRAAANGIQIMRIYDPLNDISNLQSSIQMARQESVHAQASIVYTVSSVHNTATFVGLAKKLEEMGADSICIIDNSELLTPYSCYNLIAALKKEVVIPIQLSAPNGSGLGYMNALKATEAGLDMLDTSIYPFATGASYPSTEAMVHALLNTPYDTELNLAPLNQTEVFFTGLRDSYISQGLIPAKKLTLNPMVLKYSIPGEALDYLDTILLENQSSLYNEILDLVPEVRSAAGNPPLAFPAYRGIIDQAVINATSQVPYGTVSDDFASLLAGGYGVTPAAVDPGFRENVLTNLAPDFIPSTTSTVPPELEEFKINLPEKYNEQPEDVLTLAQFPIIAPSYFERRSNKLYSIDGVHGDEVNSVHPI